MFGRASMDGFGRAHRRTFQPGRHALVPEPRRQPEAARYSEPAWTQGSENPAVKIRNHVLHHPSEQVRQNNHRMV